MDSFSKFVSSKDILYNSSIYNKCILCKDSWKYHPINGCSMIPPKVEELRNTSIFNGTNYVPYKQ